uniref:NB-ARC domain-containing protein n=1 Tax=Fagus sylvatica TaxID=28930 RepID=A0A2N9F231_FAGSY
MAEGLVADLLKQLASITAREAELIVGVDEEVQELKDKLRIIQAVMDDAKERQVTQHDEMHWLDQLKDAYYKMDDMLDNWNTARIKLEIEKEEENAADEINAAPAVMKNKKVLCSFFPSPSFCFRHVKKLALRHDIGHKIKKLSETLDKIVKDKVLSGFDLTRQLELVAVKRPKTTSFVDASDIIGRVKDKVDLVSNLLGKSSQEERSPHVISLVGIGGIGKTTLAQLSYNDNEVKTHFVQRMWVCVSDPFDQCKVARAIIKSAGGGSPDITEFPFLLEKICNLIEGKKFFLVLDDVWNEDHTKWEPFKNALKRGARGSRILVTTRNEKIAEMMQSAHIINLGVLSEKDCLLMFSKIAFFDMDEEVCKQLEDLGKKIAKKCRGFPLAIKILGSHMRLKRSREQWEGVLRSSLWELEDVERGVLHIRGLRNVIDVCEAENAQLNKKIHLRGLVLIYGRLSEREDEKDRRMKNDVLILNALEPHPDLESLYLYFYLGTTVYPNWMMSLTKLKTLVLLGFSKLECLPPLGQLPSLETLKIFMADSLKKSGKNGLESGGMREEKEDTGVTIIMPRLHSLSIERCPKLKSLPDFFSYSSFKGIEDPS